MADDKENDEKKISSKQIEKEAGLNPLLCPNCGAKCKTDSVIRYFFRRILEYVKTGKEVGITSFGTFHATKIKGRKLETPLMAGGSVEFPDRVVLRFHQHRLSKEFLNDDPPREERVPLAKKKKAPKKKPLRKTS